MKQTFLFLVLVFHINLYAQSDTNISVISVEKTGILYRGISNPIKIAVPGAKSYKVRSNGKLEKLDSIGNYSLNVTGTSGREAKIWIDIVMPDGSTKLEEKKFRLDVINHRTAYIDCPYQWKTYEMTHEQLKKLKLSTIIEDLAFQRDSAYNRVEFFIIRTDGRAPIEIKGDKITNEAFEQIEEWTSDEIYITNIITYNPHQYNFRAIDPIKLKIIKNETPQPIISLKHGNIVYRGVTNELNIVVPYCKSFTVSAQGLSQNSFGKYTLDVKNYEKNTITLDFEITTFTDSIIKDSEMFYVKNIKPRKIVINDEGCINCIMEMTIEELKNALIDIKTESITDNWIHLMVKEFEIELPNKKTINVKGDRITKDILYKLSKLPENSIFKINIVDYLYPSYAYTPLPSLKVMIVYNH